MRAFAWAFAAGAALLLVPAAGLASAEHEGRAFIALPLDVVIRYPPDGSAFSRANLTAEIEADGASVGFLDDDFANGSLVSAEADATGVRPNASSSYAESRYTSPVFELPNDLPRVEWSTTLEVTTSGTAANLTNLLALEVRFGDRSVARNWSAWIAASLDGEFGDPRGPSNESLREHRAIQYRVTFLEPTNASTPRIVQVQIWFIAHITLVEAHLASEPSWTALGTGPGRYNLSLSLSPGISVLEARATDALGAQRVARASLTYDLTPPAVATAPPTGSSIPPDEAASIVFSEPIDRASASVHVSATAGFPVDLVWSADNTTLLVSAQEAGTRGPVTITLGPRLRDRVGNEMGQSYSFTYEMGRPAEAAGDITLLLVALFAVIGVVAIAVLYFGQRAAAQKKAHAERVRTELEERARRPPGGP